MASPVTVPCTIPTPDLTAIDGDGRPIKLAIVAFNIDGPRAIPVLWPQPPGPIFVRDAAGYRRFDALTGLVSGPYLTSLSEASK